MKAGAEEGFAESWLKKDGKYNLPSVKYLVQISGSV